MRKKINNTINDMKNIVVGIDVGTTKIAVFIAEKNENNEIHVLGMGRTESQGVERGVVKNIEDKCMERG